MKLLVGYDGTHEKSTDNHDIVKTATYHIEKSVRSPYSITTNQNAATYTIMYALEPWYKEKSGCFVLIRCQIPCHDIDSPNTSINKKYHESFTHKSFDEALSSAPKNDDDQWAFVIYGSDAVMHTVWRPLSTYHHQKAQLFTVHKSLAVQNSKLYMKVNKTLNQLQNVSEKSLLLEEISESIGKGAYDQSHRTNDTTTIKSQPMFYDALWKYFVQMLGDDGNDADFGVSLEKFNSVTGTEKCEMNNTVKYFMSQCQSLLQVLQTKAKVIGEEIQIPDHSLANSQAEKNLVNQAIELLTAQPNIHSSSVHDDTQHLICLDATVRAVVPAVSTCKKNRLHTFDDITDNINAQVHDSMETYNSLAIESKMYIDPKQSYSGYNLASLQSKETNSSDVVHVVDPYCTSYKHIEAQKVSKGILNKDDDNSGDYRVNHATFSVNNHRTSVSKPYRIEKESKPRTKICVESLGQARRMQELISDAGKAVHIKQPKVPITQPKVCHIPKQEVPPKVHHVPEEQEVAQPKVHHVQKEQEVPIKVYLVPKKQEVPINVYLVPKKQEVPIKVYLVPKKQEVPTPKVHHVPEEQEVAQPKVHHVQKEQEVLIKVYLVPKKQEVPINVYLVPKKQEVPIKVYLVPKKQEVPIKVYLVPKKQEVPIKVYLVPKKQEVPTPKVQKVSIEVYLVSKEQEVAQPKLHHILKEQKVPIAQPPKEQEVFTAQQPKVILSQPAECVYENFQCPIPVSIMMADACKNLTSNLQHSNNKPFNSTTCGEALLPLVVHSAEECMSTKLKNTTNSSCNANTNDCCIITAGTTDQKQITQSVCKLDKEQCFTSAQSLCSSSSEILTDQQCELLDNINGNGDCAFVSVQSPCTKQFVGKSSETSLTIAQCLNKKCLVEVSAPYKEEHTFYAKPTCASNITTLQIKSHASCGAKKFQYQQHNKECSSEHLQDHQSHPENCNAKPLHDKQLSGHVHSLQSTGYNPISNTDHPTSSTSYQSKKQEAGKQKPSAKLQQPTKYNTQCQMLDGCCIQNTTLQSNANVISCDHIPLDPCKDHATATINANGLLVFTDNSDNANGTAQEFQQHRTKHTEINIIHSHHDQDDQDKTVHVILSPNLEVAELQNPSTHDKATDHHMTSKPHAIIIGYRGFYAYGVFFHSNEFCAIKTLHRFMQISTKYSPFTETTGLQRCIDRDLQCTIPHNPIPRCTIDNTTKKDGIQDKSTQLMNKDYKEVYSVPPPANRSQDCHSIQCFKPFPSPCHVTTQFLQSHETANICNETECGEVLSLDLFSQGAVDTSSSCLMTEIGDACIVNSPCLQKQQKSKRLKVCIKNKGKPIPTYQETFTDVKISKYSNTNSCHEKVPRDQQYKKIPPKFTPPIPPLHSKEMKYEMCTLDLFVQPQRHVVRCGKSKLQRYSTLKDYTDYRGRPPHNATDCQPISVTREVDISTNYWITQNGLTGGKNNVYGKQCSSNTGNAQNSSKNTGNGGNGRHGARFTGSSNGSSNGVYNNDNSKEGNNDDDDDGNGDGDGDGDRDDEDDGNGHSYGEESKNINTSMTQGFTQENLSADQNLPALTPSHLTNDENRIYDTGGASIVEHFPAEFSAVQPVNLQPQYFDYFADNGVNINAEQETIEQPQHDDYNDDPVTVDAEQESIVRPEAEVSNHINYTAIVILLHILQGENLEIPPENLSDVSNPEQLHYERYESAFCNRMIFPFEHVRA